MRIASFARSRARNALLLAISAAAVFSPMHLQADERFSKLEIAMLPPYCQTHPNVTTERGPEAAAVSKKWHDILGDPYRAIHHYCWGLMLTNRARVTAKNATDRRRALQGSLGEFEFILRYSHRGFVLLPEILTKRGENLLDLGRAPEGLRDLQAAAEAKPDYWPPYAIASDYYKKTGDRQNAREWLERGLAAAPDAKALQNRMAELGGGGAAKSAGKPAKPVPPAPAPEQKQADQALLEKDQPPR